METRKPSPLSVYVRVIYGDAKKDMVMSVVDRLDGADKV